MKGDLMVLSDADFALDEGGRGDARRQYDPADTEQMWGWEWLQ